MKSITLASIYKKSRLKPVYKKFIRLRENVQNRSKIFNFKRKKWEWIIRQYKKKFKRYNKTKRKDLNRYLITKLPRRGTGYENRYRDALQASKKVNLFYGSFLKKKFKKIIKSVKNDSWNKRLAFLINFEKRLDVTLYKANFCHSVRQAQQLIIHSKVKVNKQTIKSKSYQLSKGDLINIDPENFYLIKSLIKTPKNRVIITPPKHLAINYKTLQIIFNDIKNTHFVSTISFRIQNEKVILDYRNL